ncbi:aminoglycoside phosphotransferase (APT) family kinase protein [Nocardia transvalensis]|uniref:Aminoglycoside phosphotransferase (APT) family kinase protein n=1 Tax=Nocardia transvalensis TaxID=37333 RepID=A0A7W9UGY3_9NOCA|nr:aminoglycoside phosphotransferase family protein [Nocardia transvalensis]MBB5912784.1 aminoglycoside phosphotransferase (APT) family kinase protein [Nocardia transvalensis]
MTAASTAEVLVRAAELSGIDAAGAVSIRDGSNAIYELADRIVARIGKPGSYAAAARELQLSQWLNRSGIPTVRAFAATQPVVVDDRPVTWWQLIPDHRASTPDELGAMLRALHALLPPTTFQLPAYNPFAGIEERVVQAKSIGEGDRSWLIGRCRALKKQYDGFPDSESTSVIHGDAWQGNLVVPASGVPTVLDLDKVSIGRREWDLIQIAVDYTDFERIGASEYSAFVMAYGGYDVTRWPGFRVVADIQELRWTAFALSVASGRVAAAAEAHHRIACLRGEFPRPWKWSAL